MIVSKGAKRKCSYNKIEIDMNIYRDRCKKLRLIKEN